MLRKCESCGGTGQILVKATNEKGIVVKLHYIKCPVCNLKGETR